MKKLFACLICSIAFNASSQTGGAIFTGNDLAKWLDADERRTTPADRTASTALGAYVAGVSDMTAMIAPKICQPVGMTVNQLIAVVAKEVRAYPEDWTTPAAALVIRAISKAFPCPTK